MSIYSEPGAVSAAGSVDRDPWHMDLDLEEFGQICNSHDSLSRGFLKHFLVLPS